MRLFESILDANHRAVAGDATAGLHPADFADALPIVALTCVDPRLNAYFPNALGVPAEQFIWLRNAGNIITSTLSSTMRSLALACAVKGGREIAVIGHTDCQVAKTTTMQLLDRLKALGVDRSRLPENISEFFGSFGSERQNVLKACDLIRSSPLIGPQIPVHGLLLDLNTGRLDWLVNGYETLPAPAVPGSPPAQRPPQFGDLTESIGAFKEFAMGELKFPEAKIGELATQIGNVVSHAAADLGGKIGEQTAPAAEAAAPMAKQAAQYGEQGAPKTPLQMKAPRLPPLKKNPLPPPIRPHANLRRG
ncbi:MAG TPA: carbonic anhydrase [Candidatus Acidoferrales bacterium]|nr:carbonic anhydrase [Candidatus Acidoferrales bacterium]